MLLLCNYYVTYKCNSYCEFCDFSNHEKFKNTKNASLDDFKRNVSELKKMGLKFIDLTGGEPLLNRDIVDMVSFAKSLNITTSITTNTLLYKKYALELKNNVDFLHFSLDSFDEEKHNKIRGVDCFKSVMDSIQYAKEIGEHPDILFTVTNENFTELEKVYKFCKEKELMLLINPVFSYFENPELDKETMLYIEKFAKGRTGIYLNRGLLELRKNGGNSINNPLCKAVSRVIVISPDNKIILPCYHFKNEEIEIVTNIKDIRKSKKYLYYKKNQGRFGFCKGCTVNCYFEPSFFLPVNKYSIYGLGSKLKYGIYKFYKQKRN